MSTSTPTCRCPLDAGDWLATGWRPTRVVCRSTFTMLPLALHETNPGHHFQESYTRRFNIPGYRADSMNGRLFSVPFHFPVYSAYAEVSQPLPASLELALYPHGEGLVGVV